jgi:phosphate:Na+ symporter
MLVQFFGGIGLFLLGMVLLTDGLKALAGDALRRVLVRFTGRPFKAFCSGVVVTSLIQSSSATTLMTIGFVSAGLLTFAQAVGVIFGASLGTTGTGWLVAVLGLKFSIGKLAMPLVGVGAFMRLLLKGRGATAGMALAGFGLIFIGIEALKTGMEGLSMHLNPSSFPQASLFGTLLLVLIGVIMTVVMQSSSAAVATTLAAFHADTVNWPQAAALIIGQSVGTTVTAALASLGASVPARRTAMAHMLFNATTGVLALAILPLCVWWVGRARQQGWQIEALSLAAFHTGFTALGVIAVFPFLGRFTAAIERMLPDRGVSLTRHLDVSLASVPPVALEAMRRALRGITAALLENLFRRSSDSTNAEAHDLDAISRALDQTRQFLSIVPPYSPPEGQPSLRLAIVHALDHLDQLVERAQEARDAGSARTSSLTRDLWERLEQEAARLLPWLHTGEGAVPLENARQLSQSLADARRSNRMALLDQTAHAQLDPGSTLQSLDALRWMDSVAYHTWRCVHYLGDLEQVEVNGMTDGVSTPPPP